MENKKINYVLFLFVIIALLPYLYYSFTSSESRVILWYGGVITIFLFFLYASLSLTKKVHKSILMKIFLGLIFVGSQYLAYFFTFSDNLIEPIFMILPAVYFLFYLAAFVLIPKIKIEKIDFSLFFKLFVAFVLVASLYNMMINFNYMINVGNMAHRYVHLSSFFTHRNGFGQVLFMAIMAITYLISNDKKVKKNYFILGLFLINLLFTFSRASILAVAVFFVLVYLKSENRDPKNKVRNTGIIIVSSIIGLLIIINTPSLMNFLEYYVLRPDDGLTGRGNLWGAAWEILSQGGLIFGYGLGSAGEVLHNYNFTNTHNTFVEMLLTGGIVYLIIMMALYIKLYLQNRYLEKIDSKYKIFNALLIAFLVYSIFEKVLLFETGYGPFIITILIVLIPTMIYHNQKREVEEHEKSA